MLDFIFGRRGKACQGCDERYGCAVKGEAWHSREGTIRVVPFQKIQAQNGDSTPQIEVNNAGGGGGHSRQWRRWIRVTYLSRRQLFCQVIDLNMPPLHSRYVKPRISTQTDVQSVLTVRTNDMCANMRSLFLSLSLCLSLTLLLQLCSLYTSPHLERREGGTG